MDHPDIIIYALIAFVLVARLWAVFGRRNDEDRQRPNPFVTPPPSPESDDGIVVRPQKLASDATKNAAPAALLSAPMSLEGTLGRLTQLDPSFDEKRFLQDVRALFTSIVSAFAKGDLSDVQNRLGPNVFPHFQAAIAARTKAGETLENKISRIREAEVTTAQIDDSRASLAVCFVSEQENILRDATGRIINGTPGKPEEITDIWIFARDIKTPNSDWQLAETKS